MTHLAAGHEDEGQMVTRQDMLGMLQAWTMQVQPLEIFRQPVASTGIFRRLLLGQRWSHDATVNHRGPKRGLHGQYSIQYCL